MKISLYIFCFFFSINTFCQTGLLYDKIWVIQEYYAEAENQTTVFYDLNQAPESNIADLSQVGFHFEENGDFQGVFANQINHDGIWFVNNTIDSLSIDNTKYVITSLTENELILSNSSLEFGSTPENPFLVSSFIRFTSIPDDALSVDDIAISNFKLNLFPNPTSSDRFQLTFNSNFSRKNSTLEVYNMQGKRLSNYPLDVISGRNKFDIELSKSLSNGIYLVRLATSNFTKTVKLIVNK